MTVRQPAVAGQFYPANAEELSKQVRSYLLSDAEKKPALALVSPHAGYVYSGHVAGAVFSSAEIPSRLVILSPNHTGFGSPTAIMTSGVWRIPGAEIPIDEKLAGAILSHSRILEEDQRAHLKEHSLEVQLPFVRETAKEPAFVPICLATHLWEDLKEVGEAIAAAIKEYGDKVLVVASNDMSHFLPDQTARRVDKLAIDRVLALDPAGLLETVKKERISMCGVAAVTAALVAAKELGASQAALIRYATSGDIFGDRSQVVGYAGIKVW
jgi:AmmeMemoRadiSam system protein B